MFAAKLNLKKGMKVRVVGKPASRARGPHHMRKKGVQGVRQVAIDDVWSAMRFRPKK